MGRLAAANLYFFFMSDVEEIVTDGAKNLFQSPELLGHLQNKLNGLAGTSSGYLEMLPLNVRQRINALKNLKVKNLKIDAEFEREVLELEKKYLVKHEPIYLKRSEIISGTYEPTSQECVVEEEVYF
jgi:nucleosome assembly protein 1-like 1